jgi:hypothetical protein
MSHVRTPALVLLTILSGCATTPAPQPSAEELAAQEVQAREAQQSAWLAGHTELLSELRTEADTLADVRARIFVTTASWRTDPRLLNDALVDCPLVLETLDTLAQAVGDHVLESGFDALPSLPEGWNTADALNEQGSTLAERCGDVPGLIAEHERAQIAKTEAEAARTALAQNRRTKKAADALADADETLRDVVGHDLFVDYLDGMDAWQVAATQALRESVKPEPDAARLAELRELETAAKQRVGALNAGITLKISGRSNEVNDSVKAATKALEGLSEDDRAAVLAAFPPEVTPASTILIQLVTDRL